MSLRMSAVLVSTLSLPSAAERYGAVAIHSVAEGVYLFTTTAYADVGFCGNSVAVISDDGVLVFDSGATPETAQRVLAEIRRLTSKPVRFVVNSHWHWDHWGGNEVYRSAFPNLHIISHEKTLELMKTVEPRWNRKGLEVDLPAFIDSFSKKVDEAKAKHLPADKIKDLEDRLAVDREFLRQKRSLRKTYPDVTFSGAMSVWLGGKEVRVLHARAITPGDTYVYLPGGKIIIAGDILGVPYPFSIGGTHPAEWLATLKGLADLKPDIVIPGHGTAQRGSEFLKKVIALYEEVIGTVQAKKAEGLTLRQTQQAVGETADALAASLAPGSDLQGFRAYFLDGFVARTYRELEHPLGDLPDGLE